MSMDHQSKTNRNTRQSTSRPNLNMMEAGRDLNIYGGIFNQVNHDDDSGQELGIHILSRMIATDAIHDASERYPAPNVHQGTRKQILKVLTDWINDPDPEYWVFWLHGPAGAGKSAILQALAELLSSPEGHVVGSFFFDKGQVKRGSGSYLFSSLAYQLAVNVNGLGDYVNEVMRRNPTLPTKSMEVQLRTLIIEPFQRLETRPSHIQTVIVDGLDECQGDETQELILRLISDALTEHKLPLRFLIASRPEPHIRDGFDNPSLHRISNRLSLDNDFWVRKDIEKYLQDGFADICRKSRCMVLVEMPWPGKDVIGILAGHACGQFIYAATVLKFVGQKSTHPERQLEIVLHPHPSRAKAFSKLDCLYSQILSTHPNPDTLVRVLSTILAFKSPQPAIAMEEILEMKMGEVALVLEGLHSLLDVSYDDIRILHASFGDYLLDRNRSGAFYIDQTTLDAHLCTSIFSMTSNWIFELSKTTPNSKFKGFRDGPSYKPDSHTQDYISSYLATHLKNIHNCVGLKKVAAKFERQVPNRIEDASSVPFEILYSLIGPLSDAISRSKRQKLCEELLKIRKKYVAALHVCYRSVLSSGNLDTLLASLPVFRVTKKHLSRSTLAYICMLEREDVSSILGERERFMDFSFDRVRLSPHVVEFLTDKESAGVHYYDSIGPHFVLCHNIISSLFPPSWQDISKWVHLSDLLFIGTLKIDSDPGRPAVRAFWSYNLKESFGFHLNAPYGDNVVDVQHTVSLLDHLDRIDYYDPKWSHLHHGGIAIGLIWSAIKDVLLWLLKRKHDLCDTLATRCAQLFDKILRQVLCLLSAKTESGLIHFVTLLEPFRSCETSDSHTTLYLTDARESFLSDQLAAPIPGSKVPVRLSDDMLLLDLHTFELEEYLTDAERAGNFYIDADDYCKQLFYMCVEHCLADDNRWDSSVQKRKHRNLVTSCTSYLARTQGSEELYASIRPDPAVRRFRTAEGCTRILQWLNASPHTPPDLYGAWEEELQHCLNRHSDNSMWSVSSDSDGSDYPNDDEKFNDM